MYTVLNVPSKASFHTKLGKEDKIAIQDVIEGNQELQTEPIERKRYHREFGHLYWRELHPVEVELQRAISNLSLSFLIHRLQTN